MTINWTGTLTDNVAGSGGKNLRRGMMNCGWKQGGVGWGAWMGNLKTRPTVSISIKALVHLTMSHNNKAEQLAP
jgi:hypothetical protein